MFPPLRGVTTSDDDRPSKLSTLIRDQELNCVLSESSVLISKSKGVQFEASLLPNQVSTCCDPALRFIKKTPECPTSPTSPTHPNCEQPGQLDMQTQAMSSQEVSSESPMSNSMPHSNCHHTLARVEQGDERPLRKPKKQRKKKRRRQKDENSPNYREAMDQLHFNPYALFNPDKTPRYSLLAGSNQPSSMSDDLEVVASILMGVGCLPSHYSSTLACTIKALHCVSRPEAIVGLVRGELVASNMAEAPDSPDIHQQQPQCRTLGSFERLRTQLLACLEKEAPPSTMKTSAWLGVIGRMQALHLLLSDSPPLLRPCHHALLCISLLLTHPIDYSPWIRDLLLLDSPPSDNDENCGSRQALRELTDLVPAFLPPVFIDKIVQEAASSVDDCPCAVLKDVISSLSTSHQSVHPLFHSCAETGPPPIHQVQQSFRSAFDRGMYKRGKQESSLNFSLSMSLSSFLSTSKSSSTDQRPSEQSYPSEQSHPSERSYPSSQANVFGIEDPSYPSALETAPPDRTSLAVQPESISMQLPAEVYYSPPSRSRTSTPIATSNLRSLMREAPASLDDEHLIARIALMRMLAITVQLSAFARPWPVANRALRTTLALHIDDFQQSQGATSSSSGAYFSMGAISSRVSAKCKKASPRRLLPLSSRSEPSGASSSRSTSRGRSWSMSFESNEDSDVDAQARSYGITDRRFEDAVGTFALSIVTDQDQLISLVCPHAAAQMLDSTQRNIRKWMGGSRY